MLSRLHYAQSKALGITSNSITHNLQPSGIVLDTSHNNFVALDIGSNKFKLMPSPELNIILYRGQNNYYEPCLSSVDRKSLSEETRLIDNLKKIEFIELIKKNPILKNLEEYKILNCTFQNDYEGLAQHYGFLTSHLDLTNSKDIAMFFATTRYEKEEYKIIKRKEKGILYKFNYLKEYERINIIGAQGLSRSTKQKGFSLSLNKNEDFNKLVESYEIIDITQEKSEYFFNMFEGGAKLMPDDIISKKAKMILKKMDISKNSINTYMNTLNLSKYTRKDIVNILNDNKYNIINKDMKFTKKELIKISEQWLKKDKQYFIDKVSYRGIYEV